MTKEFFLVTIDSFLPWSHIKTEFDNVFYYSWHDNAKLKEIKAKETLICSVQYFRYAKGVH